MEIKEALPIGSIIDSGVHKYRIKSVLGQGGFGITYLAHSTIMVDNIPIEGMFAIKEHYISSMNERQGESVSISNINNTEEIKESIDSFLVEAQSLNKLSLNHPGIVRVNESFCANGTAYYVMEYIKGQSLREFVKQSPQGRLSEDEALKMFRPIAETISYLHENNVTHLDIKPDNILIRENGEPVVIDFGLSKHYNTKGTPTSTIKAAGCSAGYSPMEQYVGITTFTPEADIYALGATLLYMLTGKDPMISTEINEVVIRKSIPQDVSQQTSDTIVHAMEKLKESRTKTVKELLSRLQGTEKPVHTDTDNKVPDSNPTLRLKKKKIKNDINLNWRKWTIVGLSAVILIGLFYSHSQSSGDKKNIQQEKAISAEKESAKPIEMLSDYSLLRIGDYVYSDGTFSRELSKEKECSGIIFSLETTPNQKKKGWTHGKIMALKDYKIYKSCARHKQGKYK